MRKSISQIASELDQLELQGVSLTYRQKQQIAANEDVIKGKLSVADAYKQNVSKRTQPLFETVPEQNNELVKLKTGGTLPKMQDAGALMPTPEVEVDPVKPTAEEYRNNIQSNYKGVLQNNPRTPYIPNVTEGGMNCINGVCSLIKRTKAKEFTRNTYTGNATFNDNLEREGYYTVDPTKEAFEIGDIVQYSRKKGRAQRFGGRTTPLNANELFPQHAKIITDKFVDKDGETQYVIVHNYGEEGLSQKTISEKELLSHTKGYGNGLSRFDGLLVQRYSPDVVAKNIAEREAKKRVLEGENEFAKEYNVPVTYIKFSTPKTTLEGENYNKTVNKDLSKVYTENYDKLARMSNVPKSTFDQMLALQAGIQHMESGKGGLRAVAKNAIPDFLLDEARQLTSDSDAKTWVDVYWKDNAENVKDKFKTKQEFKNHLNRNNKLSASAAEWVYYNSPRSKGAFQQKELSERGKFLKIDPSLESYEDQAIASLALMIDNYHRVKKQYPEATEKELLDLSTLMHNSPGKALTPEFYRYFVKNNDVDYVNEVKKYVPKINITQAQSRELPQEEIDSVRSFIEGLSDSGPQMRYGGSLPDLPKYQNGTRTIRTSDYSEFKRLKQAERDSLAAYNEGLQHFNAEIAGRNVRVWDGSEGFFSGGTETRMNKMEDLIVKDSKGNLDAEGADFDRIGTDEIKSNPQEFQYKNTGIQPIAALTNRFGNRFGRVDLYQYFKKPETTVVFDNPYQPGSLSEGDFPTPSQINNMGAPTKTKSSAPTPTPTEIKPTITKIVKDTAGNIISTKEGISQEEAGKRFNPRTRSWEKLKYGGYLPKYQNGTNPEEVYYGKTLPEVTVRGKLDRTNPTAVRNYNRVNNPIAYAATEATDKFASNYLMPVAEMAPGTGDLVDIANFGDAVDKGDYGTAAMYAGFGLLPGSATPLVKGAKKLGRGIKNIYQEAIFRGIEPVGYGAKRKVKDFIPNLIKNSRRSLEERALDLGYNTGTSSGSEQLPRTLKEIRDDIKKTAKSQYVYDATSYPFPDHELVSNRLKKSRRIGADLLDSFNMGLRRKQNWDTFESLGDDVYRINPSRPGTEIGMFRDLSDQLKEYNKYLKKVDQYKTDINTLSPEKMSEYGLTKPEFDFKNWYGHLEPNTNRFHIEGDNIRGNYTIDVKPSTGPTDPMTFTATDRWDLHPFNKGPLKNLEMLKLFGGKPYTIKNTYDVDPQTFNVLRSYRNGGYLSRYRKRK